MSMTRTRPDCPIECTDREWDKLCELWLELFFAWLEADYEQSRPEQWMTLAEMALGKAQMAEEGRYLVEDDQFGIKTAAAAADLRGLARRILDYFKPGAVLAEEG
ncbi:MAG: hypothetical protein L0Y72_29465 [Gemmataceae bacterium]|nr:hypothetical protein [Gemmataceae bacterium]MCI0743176.1 hypothetical protein [Gemmataceae bacterium]